MCVIRLHNGMCMMTLLITSPMRIFGSRKVKTVEVKADILCNILGLFGMAARFQLDFTLGDQPPPGDG
jgi:hypothetical protein